MSVAAKADAVSDHFDHLVGRGEDLTEHRLWSRPAQLAAPLNFCVSAPTHPQPARLSNPRTAAARLSISRPKSELVDRGELIVRQKDLHIFSSKNCCARCSTSFLCRASITPAFQRHTAFNVISSADGTSQMGKMRSRSNCMVTVPASALDNATTAGKFETESAIFNKYLCAIRHRVVTLPKTVR